MVNSASDYPKINEIEEEQATEQNWLEGCT